MSDCRLIGFVFLTLILVGCKSSDTVDPYKELQWSEVGDAKWSFEGDHIKGVANGTTGYLISRKPLSDFILELEFKPDSTINSGVFVRCMNEDMNPYDCHEINIFDLHPNQEFRTGAIVTRTEAQARLNTIGKWNKYRITCRGDNTSVWLNDLIISVSSEPGTSPGIIGLQASGNGSIVFRNIRIRVLN